MRVSFYAPVDRSVRMPRLPYRRVRPPRCAGMPRELAPHCCRDIAADLVDDASELDRSVLDALLQPVIPDEIWAAGVTYEISEEAREQESSMADMYLNVYESERPEVSFKGTQNQTVVPDDDVGIRSNSGWNVPESHIGIVLYRGDPNGDTIENDVDSREIKGETCL